MKIYLTTGQAVLIDDEDFEKINQYPKWFYSHGYAKFNKVIMHRLIMSAPKGYQVDHINGNGLDNRKDNLRLCKKTENGWNRKLGANNTSGYKGVTRHKRSGKWQCQIKFMGKKIYLGLFDNAIDAAKVYDSKATELFGKFAKLNFGV